MKNLISNIKKTINLSESSINLIESVAQLETYHKKQILEDYHTIYKHLYFVEKGCIQLCLLDENGKEQTIQFSINGWWLTDFDSFNYQKKSFYQLKAVKESKVIKFSKTDLEELRVKIPELETYFRLISERAYAASLYRVSLLITKSKENRYLHYVKHFSQFAKSVPQYVLASYLGISPEYLSEMKNKTLKS